MILSQARLGRNLLRRKAIHDGSPRRYPDGREDEERPTADIIKLARQYGRSFYRSR